MLLYALRRLIYLVPVAFGVSLLVFGLVHLAPGDPISAIVPPDAPKEVIDKLKEYYGFDKPLPVQYFRWLGVTLTGDFGTSIGTGRSVAARSHRRSATPSSSPSPPRRLPSRWPSSSALPRPMPSRASSTGSSP